MEQLTSPTITSITTGSLGVLHNDPFPTQLLAVQVIHSIVCITGVIEFNKPIPLLEGENIITGFNEAQSETVDSHYRKKN